MQDLYMNMLLSINEDFDDDLLQDTMEILVDLWNCNIDIRFLTMSFSIHDYFKHKHIFLICVILLVWVIIQM